MSDVFHIIDYNADREGLGVWFYSDQILFGHEKDLGLRSYRFKVKIALTSDKKAQNVKEMRDWTHIVMGRLDRDDYEYLDFIYTCNLKSFAIEVDVNPKLWDGKTKSIDFDWESLINVAAKDDFERAKKRLIRKRDNIIPAATMFVDCYEKEVEFLAFDEDSEHGTFCGNFDHIGKSGCAAKLKFQPNSDEFLEEFNFDLNSYRDLPESAQKQVSDLAEKSNQKNNEANFFGRWPKEEKQAFFDSLSLRQKIALYKTKLKNLASDECLEMLRPYSIYLYGTDDVSYTKWFNSEEDQLAEMNYLRMMQPLNFDLDILQRGYIFTN